MSLVINASASRRSRPRQARGNVQQLPSGSWRVRVYAGMNPATRRPRYVSETVPDGPEALLEIEDVRQRLLSTCRGNRAQGGASVAELINRHILLLTLSDTTRQRYFELASTHIIPMIGHLQIHDLKPEMLEECYARLLRCREHCGYLSAPRAHQDEHLCRPLARSTVRKLHFLIGAAYQSALRWGWLLRSPIVGTRPPASEPPRPRPPGQDQARRILASAWGDPDFGPMVWLAMASGVRRGELCALRWRDFDPDRRQLVVERSIAHTNTVLREKDTKTHNRRHILLDHKTVAMLTTYHHHRRQRATQADVVLSDDSFLFSPNADGLAPRRPNSVTGWYRRLVHKLGIVTSWHKLRHFNATELIGAGVDVRTVAGRLGHADGGTTLKYYSAWIKEADQRASIALARLLPLASNSNRGFVGERTQPARYFAVAEDLRHDIASGRLPCGAVVPTTADLAAAYHIAPSTAHRAIAKLADDGLVISTPGHRTVVAPQSEAQYEERYETLPAKTASHEPSLAP